MDSGACAFGLGFGLLWLTHKRHRFQGDAGARLDSLLAGATDNATNVTPERDLAGYGERPPDPRWPGGAKVFFNLSSISSVDHLML